MRQAHRDIYGYEVLVNEAGVDVDEPDKSKTEKWTTLWDRAASQRDCPSEITVGEANGELLVAIHKTWSDMHPVEWMWLGQLLVDRESNDFYFNLDVEEDTAYLTIFLSGTSSDQKLVTKRELKSDFRQIDMHFKRQSL